MKDVNTLFVKITRAIFYVTKEIAKTLSTKEVKNEKIISGTLGNSA